MLGALRRWKRAKVRAWQFGRGPDYPWYIRLTPNFGIGCPWFGGQRLRLAVHHGIQITQRLSSGRWVVARQLLGTSKVKGEKHGPVRHS